MSRDERKDRLIGCLLTLAREGREDWGRAARWDFVAEGVVLTAASGLWTMFTALA